MFSEIKATDIKENLIDLIKNEWMLITAGDRDGYNMMTASWGFMGEMWSRDCVIAAVRPQRYTMEFLDKSEYFSLTFFGERKDIHKVCGNESGRDVNKTEKTGLTPIFSDGTVYFNDARLVVICRKKYVNQLNAEAFTDGDCNTLYPADDRHNMIIGEIVKVLVNK